MTLAERLILKELLLEKMASDEQFRRRASQLIATSYMPAGMVVGSGLGAIPFLMAENPLGALLGGLAGAAGGGIGTYLLVRRYLYPKRKRRK